MRTMLGDISPHLHLVKKYQSFMRTMCYVLQVSSSDNVTITAVHEKPMDLQRIPKDTQEVPKKEVSRQPIKEQEIPNQSVSS